MRDKTLLQIFLFLNVALAGCFAVYLFLNSNDQPKVAPASITQASPNSNASVRLPISQTNSASLPATNVVVETATNEEPIAPAPKPVLSQRRFNWELVQSPDYTNYIASLRAVGCPEDKIRNIILTDINDLFSQKRLKEAVVHDPQWWKARPDLMITGALQEKGRTLEEERRALVARLLGAEALETERSEAMLWSSVQLTGPVLGKLPTEVHNAVQEICNRSIERTQGAFWARVNDGQQPNPVDMAHLREQTRVDLRKILSPDAMEEFLLRYSHNSEQLRAELFGMNPTAEEFRKVFRATDSIEHQMQLEFGGVESMSQQQRERYERQREAAIKETLGVRRYEEYLTTKDPLYRQAQSTARQYGAPDKAIQPIYQMSKRTEEKRRKILVDAAMTPEQKSAALNAVNLEQMQSVQKIISDSASQP
jgi:hypothetical protein